MFSSNAVVKGLLADSEHPLNGRVAAALAASPTPASMADVAKLYSKLLQDVYAEWLAAAKDPEAAVLSDPDAEALRQVLYAPDSPTRVPERTRSPSTATSCAAGTSSPRTRSPTRGATRTSSSWSTSRRTTSSTTSGSTVNSHGTVCLATSFPFQAPTST